MTRKTSHGTITMTIRLTSFFAPNIRTSINLVNKFSTVMVVAPTASFFSTMASVLTIISTTLYHLEFGLTSTGKRKRGRSRQEKTLRRKVRSSRRVVVTPTRALRKTIRYPKLSG